MSDDGTVRTFGSGATRDTEEGKYDYDGFLSPVAMEAFGAYMHKHREQSNGALRDSDNWQKGMGLAVFMKSGWRHFFAWWKAHRSPGANHREVVVEALCALMFNIQGYLHEFLKADPQEGRTVSVKEVEVVPPPTTHPTGIAWKLLEGLRVIFNEEQMDVEQHTVGDLIDVLPKYSDHGEDAALKLLMGHSDDITRSTRLGPLFNYLRGSLPVEVQGTIACPHCNHWYVPGADNKPCDECGKRKCDE